MADDVLSPAELETLLTATEPIAAPRRASVPRPAPAETIRSTSAPKQRPSVCQQQLILLRTVHERFASRIAEALFTSLRCSVEAKLVSLDQPSYGELVRGLDSPACLGVLRSATLTRELAVDIHHAILLPVIDRQLGGGRHPASPTRRPLSTIEQRLAARIIQTVAGELCQAWRDVHDLQLSVARLEYDPQKARLAPRDEIVVRLRLDLVVGTARGMVTICLPGDLLRSIDRESCCRPEAADGPSDDSNQRPEPSTVALVAQLARTRVSKVDLDRLQVGDIITSGQDVRGPLSVRVDGVPRFLARGGVADGRKAVRIDEVIDEPSRDDAS